MKLKISFDNENEESFCEARSSLKYTHIPDNFLWSDEVKTEYQDAFQSNDIQQKLIDIVKQLEAGCMNVKSIIDDITNVIVLAGNKSLVRKSFKPTKRKLIKNGMIRIVEVYLKS